MAIVVCPIEIEGCGMSFLAEDWEFFDIDIWNAIVGLMKENEWDGPIQV